MRLAIPAAVAYEAPVTSAAELPRVLDARFAAGAAELGQLPPPVTAELAFAGRSNVGKSSLLNTLLGRRNLVRTSSTPGCTRQINFLDVDSSDGSRLTLVDLPGYGYAKRSKQERKSWDRLIEGYLLERVTLRAVVLLVDIRRGVEPDDQQLLDLLAQPARVARRPLSLLVVATKLDKLPVSQRKLSLIELKKSIGLPVIGFSAKEGIGRDELWRRLRVSADIASEPAPVAQSGAGNDRSEGA